MNHTALDEADLPSWQALEQPPPPENDSAAEEQRRLLLEYGRIGERVLADLRSRTVENALTPAASDAELRHLEGQRFLVRYIITMIAQARAR